MEALSGEQRQVARDISGLWWLWLVFGIAWTAIGLVILQFDQASINTVGILIGLMFLGSAGQNFAIAAITDRLRWVFIIFGFLFVAAGVVTLISPENTFAALADILGFLFLLVGIFWTIQALESKEVNPLWWFGLIAGILMIIMAFYTAGQFFTTKQFILLVFAGIWALMHGIQDLIRAFQIRHLRQFV